MIKHLLIIHAIMILLISIGTYLLYEVVGEISGQDAMCFAGIFAGFTVGLWYGKYQGLSSLKPLCISAVIISFSLVAFSLAISRSGIDYVVSLAFLSIGFSLLIFYLVGLVWGKHLISC